MPVYEGSIDKILGIIIVKDLLCLVGSDNLGNFNLRDFIREGVFIPEKCSCADTFKFLTGMKSGMAIVVDEYGGTAGIVTLEDIVESVMGNIQDEYDDEEEEIRKINETTFTVEGTTDIDEIDELVGTDLPEGDYDTLGGFVISLLGYLPSEVGEEPIIAEYKNLRFTVLSIDERRIDEIKIEILPESQESDNTEED